MNSDIIMTVIYGIEEAFPAQSIDRWKIKTKQNKNKTKTNQKLKAKEKKENQKPILFCRNKWVTQTQPSSVETNE